MTRSESPTSASHPIATATAGWYAVEPSILVDPAARARLTDTAVRRAPVSAAATAAALEAAVAHAPETAFTFDARGGATLQADGRVFGAGHFSTPTIGELRAALRGSKAPAAPLHPGRRARLSVLVGADVLTDIGTLQAAAPAGVLFQVASQFNCLEAPSDRVVPVRDYVSDPTQGPRASISALPGTLLRHYRAPAGAGRFVQSSARSLNLLGDVLDPAVAEVRCGYLSTANVRDLPATAAALTGGFERIRIGVHDDVEVMFGHGWDGAVEAPGPRIAQVFTSTIALGGYGKDDGSRALTEARRQLLRAAYVGTLFAAASLGKHTVVLTLIGGGVFGNPHDAIWEAIRFALAEIDGHAVAPLHAIVNTRLTPPEEALPEDARAEVLRRGGFVATFGAASVAVEG